MASVNKVILMGNLGKDPEVRFMPNGDAVCNFSIATTDNWKDKNGEKQERTEWHNIVMYRKLAEIAGEYLKRNVVFKIIKVCRSCCLRSTTCSLWSLIKLIITLRCGLTWCT